MALVLRELYKTYNYYVIDCKDPRLDDFFLMQLIPIVTLLAFYLYFVKKLGPKLMEQRKPFELKSIMIVYNVLQVVLNFVLGFVGVYHVLLTFNFKCQEVNYTGDRQAYIEAYITYCYFLLKVFDLLDTVFFVLRKKFSQISFLHVYHHTGVAFAAYLTSRYMPCGHVFLLGQINVFVHVPMYFYYLLTCIRPEFKKSISWKKKITQLQIVQFAVLIVHFLYPLVFGNCSYSKFWLTGALAQNIFFLVMFTDFYIEAYFKKPKDSVE